MPGLTAVQLDVSHAGPADRIHGHHRSDRDTVSFARLKKGFFTFVNSLIYQFNSVSAKDLSMV